MPTPDPPDSLLLDTHCWIWMEQGKSEEFSRSGLSALNQAIEAGTREFHQDPSDRIIVATARRLGIRLLTRDRKLLEYGREGHVRVLSA